MIETEEDYFVAILPCSHPLASQKEIQLLQLKNESLLLQNENSMIYQKIEELCKQVGFNPQVTYKGVRVEILLSMVEKELGISILMRKSIQHQLSSKVIMLPLVPNKISHLSFVARSIKHSAAVDTFFKYLENNEGTSHGKFKA